MPDRLTYDRLRQLRDDEYVCANENERSMAAELLELRQRVAELEGESRNMTEGLKSFMRVVDAAADFINQRPEYVAACRNAHPDNIADYCRWQGGAEARRQLAERLGWTVPYEFGDKTAPKENGHA